MLFGISFTKIIAFNFHAKYMEKWANCKRLYVKKLIQWIERKTLVANYNSMSIKKEMLLIKYFNYEFLKSILFNY